MDGSTQLDLHGKRALVTGGARGLGAAICRRLAAAGASVLVADVRQDLAEDLCEALAARGEQARYVPVDVREPAQVAEVFRDLDTAGDALHILVNCAAVDVSKSAEHLTADEVTRVVTTNLLGPMYLCLEAYRRMVARGGGHIVNILSTAACRTWTEAGPYSASKSGLRAFTHTLFKEAQRDCLGIGITGVIAGGMETAFIMERFPDTDVSLLQNPDIVADTVMYALSVPGGSGVPEVVIVPRRETSWP
ncbi:SDR family oxidoreductase [Streptomyces sp. WAC06614]|uniref:SDR family oxidoreductase n=1 Tax=Streptomyces sp. WAC06614 TaxID=2487416 RepID=UPI000F78A6E5|nr:SDR family oxidoreductase [Streptomyces sp. WAC06614]RSS67488.1 SDR family oxidoreductase [Streptomyces sp. WAC06614]